MMVSLKLLLFNNNNNNNKTVGMICSWQERTFNEQQRSVRELNLRQLVAQHRQQMLNSEVKLLDRKHQLMRCEQSFPLLSLIMQRGVGLDCLHPHNVVNMLLKFNDVCIDTDLHILKWWNTKSKTVQTFVKQFSCSSSSHLNCRSPSLESLDSCICLFLIVCPARWNEFYPWMIIGAGSHGVTASGHPHNIT